MRFEGNAYRTAGLLHAAARARARCGTQVPASHYGVRGRNFLNGIRGAERTAPTYATIILAEDRVRTWYNALQVRIQLGARSADRASSFDGAGGAGSSTVNR